jgi:Lhr-like helicases
MAERGTAAAFGALNAPVREALADRGFETPTEPQRRAIPPIVEGRDTLVVAPTGTGKTETAMLPVFDSLVEDGERFGFGALYVTPLRALNRDMRDRLDWVGVRRSASKSTFATATRVTTAAVSSRRPAGRSRDTPETLQAMLTGKKLRRALSD